MSECFAIPLFPFRRGLLRPQIQLVTKGCSDVPQFPQPMEDRIHRRLFPSYAEIMMRIDAIRAAILSHLDFRHAQDTHLSHRRSWLELENPELASHGWISGWITSQFSHRWFDQQFPFDFEWWVFRAQRFVISNAVQAYRRYLFIERVQLFQKGTPLLFFFFENREFHAPRISYSSRESEPSPALPLFHSFRNSFHSATPWALRR